MKIPHRGSVGGAIVHSGALLLAVVLVISTAAPSEAFSLEASTAFVGLDSGVFGIIPHYVDDLARIQKEVDSLRNEISHTSDACAVWQLKNSLESTQGLIDDARNQSVQAFQAAGELPLEYPMRGALSWEVCSDLWKFPRNFSGLVSTVRADKRGAFRMPLPPGRYAIFVGWILIGHLFSTNPWWQFVEVKRHEWNQLVPPNRYHPHQPCQLDWDCADGMVCGSRPGLLGTTCEERAPSLPPSYDSGIVGVLGSAVPNDYQCVEAFRDHGDLMSACARCYRPIGDFKLPLAPGAYKLDFRGFWNPRQRTNVDIEVAPHQWKKIDAQVHESGPPDSPCAAKEGYVRAH